MNAHAIRVVTLDSYMSFPIPGFDTMYSEFRGSSVSQVPILRLFGSIPTGEKICIHVHGVFPYLYIPFGGNQDACSLMYKIAASIDKAVNISLNQASSNMQHVYKITLVQGIPMYGYHNREHQFYKIHLYNPLLIRKVTSLLMNESTLGSLYQPHEAHLNFTLQFMIDYNQHGMNNMILSKLKYRQGSKINVDPELLLPSTVTKMTVCELEGDCLAEDILNREEISSGNISANPGIASLWADEQQRRRNKGLDSQIEHPLELNRTNVPPTNSHLIYKQALRERLAVFSNEKNQLNKLNSTVYPSETPNNVHIQNASMVDSQTTSSFSDSSLISYDHLDETITPVNANNMSTTLDEDCQQLLHVLNELEKEAFEKIEEDSILTQLTKEYKEEKEMENEIDFSMSIEAVTTPTKVIPVKNDAAVDSDDDLWETTLIHQVDGCCDETVEEINVKSSSCVTKVHIGNSALQVDKPHLPNVFYLRLMHVGKDMPDLDKDYFIENLSCKQPVKRVIPPSLINKKSKNNVRNKKPVKHLKFSKKKKYRKIKKLTKKQLLQKEVQTFEYRIRKLKRQEELSTIMKKLYKKENKLILFLEKNHPPKFRVIPQDQLKTIFTKKSVDVNKTSRVKILSDIIVNTANYVDPTLHLIIKYPNSCCYLYVYNSNFLPKVTKIPRKICQSKKQEVLGRFIKKIVNYKSWFNNQKCKVSNSEIKEHDIQDKKISEENPQKSEPKIDVELLVFFDNYKTVITDPKNLMDISTKSNKDLNKIAEDLQKQLTVHIQFLATPYTSLQYNNPFSYEEEHTNILNDIKCLKSTEVNHDLQDNVPFSYQEECINILKNINFRKVENDLQDVPFSCEEKHTNILKDPKINEFNNNVHKDKHLKRKTLPKRTKNYKHAENINEPLRRSMRIKDKQQKLLSLDGTVDSDSSSEEEHQKIKRKRRPPRESRYKALPITLEKSPKALNSLDKDPAVGDLVSFAQFSKKKTSSIATLNQISVCEMNVKRKLFHKESNPTLHNTIVEEKLVCSYSPSSRKSLRKENMYDAPSDLGSDINKNYNLRNKSILEEDSSSSIFSSDSESHEKSFFNSEITNTKGLTTAEKYDQNTNYKAKEGCSKYVTSNSSQSLSQPLLMSSGSSSSELLTPYQKLRIESIANLQTITEESLVNEETVKDICSQGSYKILEESVITNSDNITLVPKLSAPTREVVLKSLDEHKIPHIINEVPFYSIVDDVSGSVEVGFNTLKIKSKSTAHLPDFKSQIDALNSFRKTRIEQLPSNIKFTKSNINNIILSHCKNKDCIITPFKKPPALQSVNDWLTQKSKKVCIPEQRTEKVKIHVPVSPGAKSDDDDDTDISLTLSPVTPRSSQISQVSEKTSFRSASPVLGHECKKRKNEIRNKVRSQFLRNSLSLSQENSLGNSGQITGVTRNYSYLNRSVHNLQNARAIIEHQNLTVLVMELHIRTRDNLKPDPAYDSVRAIFYSILHDVPNPNPKGRNRKGVIAINSLPLSPGTNQIPILDGIGLDCDITYVDSEDNLINDFLKVLHYWDPDIFAGYEIELLSWGYLIERGYVLGINLKELLGRTSEKVNRQRDEDSLNELKLTGRIVLDVWRLMRHEIALQSYTFESVSYHILNKRFPYYSFKDLSFWWDHKTQLHRHKTVKYYMTRVTTILELFDKLDFLGRTSELARLFGIQFFEVLSRGSQFRVESMMLRLAKPLNFIAVSPSVQQRAHMKAPEYIALVMEPESKLYNDPIIVLDFQSLYPSIIIAYNYCFTTCIGRVESSAKSGPFEFGATQLKISKNRLRKFVERDQLNFSPCGVGFVKKKVRDGIMPRMLREILDTRLMVKNSMKENKDDKILQKVLHNRQLGLKLIANVTYGYTAANFSGRMPCVELGDSVVSKGRETLQRAVELVDNNTEWGARVVYGDTDSLFVLVQGRTKEYAFEIGKQIAEAVTNSNPDPIKLKLEKVYQPCILQTKKRYVGYMYESPDQKDPVYDAKGIETVRRDGCPAVSKMLEKCLRILFETKDVSLVKKYVLKQFNKIIAGRVSIQELTFAKEYRGASGYKPGACVPALELTKKWMMVDKRNEPRSGERVPYVIVNGPPGLPLIRMVRSPRDLLNDDALRPNAIYYITRVIIPPINRCFNLIGADLNTWFNQMPRKKLQYFANSVSPKKKTTISHYFSTSSCISCEEQTQTGICQNCSNKPQSTVFTLLEKMRVWESNYQNIILICQSCTSSVNEVRCISLDCPVYYRRAQASKDKQQTTVVRQLLNSSDF